MLVTDEKYYLDRSKFDSDAINLAPYVYKLKDKLTITEKEFGVDTEYADLIQTGTGQYIHIQEHGTRIFFIDTENKGIAIFSKTDSGKFYSSYITPTQNNNWLIESVIDKLFNTIYL